MWIGKQRSTIAFRPSRLNLHAFNSHSCKGITHGLRDWRRLRRSANPVNQVRKPYNPYQRLSVQL